MLVHGDENVLHRAREALAALESSNPIEPSADGAECPVCFCELDDPVKLDCGHLYCRSYLRPSPQDPSFSVRKCMAEAQPGDSCGMGIGYSTIRSLLTSAEEDTLLRASFLSFVNEHPTELRYCPSPDCEMVYRPASNEGSSSFQCPSCLVDICPACNVAFHEGMSCEEHQDNLGDGLAALAKWREEHGVKQCPNCHADIEKDGGCNHMTCALCKAHIWWICMQTFGDEDSSGGVYNHLRKVHGGYM
ncbi:hypothetical protein FB45DRAFT_1118020 [Roridomyces roridus]|uniref:RING-type domain-containing protein n=1 Tax=Roridomyces roridus TaxID=1738132 RepID=A0AAD7B7H4_9AGAR|nr:hypothetical protein FB45DRAFT_1118020 [Roridomyces roridus]